MFVTVQDFVGKYQLSTGMYDASKLQEYIDKYEKQYLIELFGAKLYDEFMSDLDVANVPQSPNFIKIFNPFYENIAMNQLIISDGILEMLKGFIYYEYSKDLINQMTPVGMVRPIGENSETVSTLYSMIYTRYNTAIKSYRAIQMYIMTNMTQAIGQAVSITLSFGGSGYLNDANDVPTTATVGSGLTLDIVVNAGSIDSATINKQGQDYQVDSIVTVLDGNSDAYYLITYAGKGNYRWFRGIEKQTAYWI